MDLVACLLGNHQTFLLSLMKMVMMFPMDRRKSYLTDGVFRIVMKRLIVSFGVLMAGCTVATECLRIPTLGSQVIQMHSVNLLMLVFGDTIRLAKPLRSLLEDYQIPGGLISTTTGRGVQHVVSVSYTHLRAHET